MKASTEQPIWGVRSWSKVYIQILENIDRISHLKLTTGTIQNGLK